MEKQLITQKHELGCGIACLAFVANTSYDNVIKIFGEDKARNEGLRIKEMKEFLKTQNLLYNSCHANKAQTYQICKNNSIAFIRRDKFYPFGHFLAYYEGKWMDPYYNLSLSPIQDAKAGWRYELPGKLQWLIHEI